MSYLEEYRKWLSIPALSDADRQELKEIENDENELKTRFGSSLSFGTAGLRGKMKLGTNAMNVYTVARTTQGLANYILSQKNAFPSVVIAHDSRNNSELFANTAASVLAANNIHVYLFDDLRPTPELSFSVRYLECIAGINITASHNPKEYNGYKAYWSDGAQIGKEQADGIGRMSESVDIINGIRSISLNEGIREGKIDIIGKEVDEAYLRAVLDQAIDLDSIRRVADELDIVYSPLHGAGYRLVPEIISRIGIKHFHIVPEQATPDGNFPTTKKPNPEYPEVFEQGITLADKTRSDLIIATDPDADRVGIMVRGSDGKFITLTGNQTGALLLDYIINSYKTTGKMPSHPYAVKSIVTTELMSKICRDGGVELFNVLTGFKYIGEKIKEKEESGVGSFIFGAEESYGYLKGTYARDKDAVVATMLICEMTAYYKLRKMTLADALKDLYGKYGFSLERTQEIIFDDYCGNERMKTIMAGLRSSPILCFGENKVKEMSDYKTRKITDISSNTTRDTGLPQADVLRYELENSDVIIIRPSGTEPKLKFYYLISAENTADAEAKLAKYKNTVDGYINQPA